MIREDLVSYLNSLRKSEAEDPNHRWIGTYNTYLIILITFFKWLYYPKMDRSIVRLDDCDPPDCWTCSFSYKIIESKNLPGHDSSFCYYDPYHIRMARNELSETLLMTIAAAIGIAIVIGLYLWSRK
jgi:hypothetical protein